MSVIFTGFFGCVMCTSDCCEHSYRLLCVCVSLYVCTLCVASFPDSHSSLAENEATLYVYFVWCSSLEVFFPISCRY